MTGLPPFSIEKDITSFRRTFTKLGKSFNKANKNKYLDIISGAIEELIKNPCPSKARQEPLPKGIHLPNDWKFYKLEIYVEKGASGQIRLMYLVSQSTYRIKPVWIYSHEQFSQRPQDKDLSSVISDALYE